MQLVYSVDRRLKSMDCGERILTIVLDFMKAFDRVWHKGLLLKLCQLGLATWTLNWICSYLSERSISVRVGSRVSTATTVNAGVPQGSHLGPVLFLICINDLPDSTPSSTELFADDTVIHKALKDLSPERLDRVQLSVKAAKE